MRWDLLPVSVFTDQEAPKRERQAAGRPGRGPLPATTPAGRRLPAALPAAAATPLSAPGLRPPCAGGPRSCLYSTQAPGQEPKTVTVGEEATSTQAVRVFGAPPCGTGRTRAEQLPLRIDVQA